jgi:SAM-dependent methyltransferase
MRSGHQTPEAHIFSARFLNMTNSQMSHPALAKAARLEILGKSPARFYVRLNKRIWERIPASLRDRQIIRSYGAWLHTLVCLHARREMYFGTHFLRNRPALELMRRLVEPKPKGSTLRIAVLACSIGAEVYSILWIIRSARPDLKIILRAVDISPEILKFGEQGIYRPNTSELVHSSIFARLNESERREMFDWEGEQATIKPWLREGIIWQLADATTPEITTLLGLQDIVVGSNFLCHMAPEDAEKCLRNIVRLVRPGGHLFVSGVDLNVRTRVALDLGWKPVRELLAEIHDGDPSVRADWPWHWWGIEPLCQRKPNWEVRYAAAFQVN